MKRKFEINNIEYVIIETIEIGEVFVQFIPSIWLAALANKNTYKPRDPAKFYFPRRLPNQSRAKHLKFLKEAKFICMKPENDDKWELRDCRILKLGLDSIEDAIDNEKLFMEYFSTTDAEATLKKAAESKCVKTKKTKKAPAKKSVSSSESDDESPAATKISNYNAHLAANIQNLLTLDDNTNSPESNQTNQDLFTLDGIDNVLLDNNHMNHNTFTVDTLSNYILTDQTTNQNLCNVDAVRNTLPENYQTTHQNLLTLSDVNFNQPNEFLTAIEVTNDDFDRHALEEIDFDLAGQHNNSNSSSQGNCKCLQKVLNKMDYFSKKVFKELSSIREEIKLNRTLCVDRSNSHEIQQENIDPNEEEQQDVVTVDQFETFTTKYKTSFPAMNFEILLETNQYIASDKNFKDYLRSKLEKHQGANDVKTVRKIMKSLCDVHCLNECTWSGTKKKDGTIKKPSFARLESIVELITEVIEKKFPNCDAIDILKSVVQQKTKSAGEAVANLNEKLKVLVNKNSSTAVSPDVNIEQGSTAVDDSDKISNLDIEGDLTNVIDMPEINPDSELNEFRQAVEDVPACSS